MNQASDTPWLEETYARLAPRLHRIVGRNVQAPECLIEDACQIAWGRWVVHRDEVPPGSMLRWLATTATREALHLVRYQSRLVSLEAHLDKGGELVEFPVRNPGPDQVAEFRTRLAEVRRLPGRQQTAVWLQGFGFNYREIASRTGSTRRIVERDLMKARRALADAT
jgi:RNA polymerase sigma factor (sigma-70 family)